MKIVVTVMAAGLMVGLAGCAPPPSGGLRAAVQPRPAAVVLPASVRVQVHEAGRLVVRNVALDDYVAAAILSEFDPPAADQAAIERMFEVQAIVARTYAVSNSRRHAAEGFDLCSTTHCQLYAPARLKTSKWAAAARLATSRTAGEVVTYDGAVAHVVFHADCGGHTSSAAAVWGGAPTPYLVPESDAIASDTHAAWTFEATTTQVRQALNADPRTAVGPHFIDIEISERDEAGRAEKVTLRGTRTFLVRGEVFRDVLTRTFGVKSLRSTLMTISRRGDRVTFTGRGFGHGVGLCQTGAFARIQAGELPEDVVARYFPGTTLMRQR